MQPYEKSDKIGLRGGTLSFDVKRKKREAIKLLNLCV